MEPRPLPPDIRDQLRIWNRTARALRAITVLLTIAAIVLSILVASEVLSDDVQRGAAVGAAIATGLLTGLGLVQKSNGARNAWRHLNAESKRYQRRTEPDDAKADQLLIEAYEKGETLMGDVSLNAAAK